MPEDKLRMQLTHKEWPGYRVAFYLTIAATIGYLAFVFVASLI